MVELQDTCGCGTQHLEQLSAVQDTLEDVEAVLKGLRVPVLKAPNPFKKQTFLRMEAKLLRRVLKEFNDIAEDDIASIQKLIQGLNLNDPEDIDRFVRGVDRSLRGLDTHVAKKVVPVLEANVEDMYRASKIGMINELLTLRKLRSRSDVATFGGKDERMVELLQKNQTIYIKQGFKQQIKNFDTRAKKILSDSLARGSSQKVVTASLQAAFGGSVDNPNYWNVVGSAWMNRTRNWAGLQSFDDGGIEAYAIEAVLDERTSAICKGMHGKQFSVPKQLEVEMNAAETETLGSLKEQKPWLEVLPGKDGKPTIGFTRRSGRFTKLIEGGNVVGDLSRLQKEGFALPPFHGLCRTTVVAV